MPILNPTVHRQILYEILMQNILDDSNSWDLNADGEYLRTLPLNGNEAHHAHNYFLTHESLSGKGAGSPPLSKPHRQREQDL